MGLKPSQDRLGYFWKQTAPKSQQLIIAKVWFMLPVQCGLTVALLSFSSFLNPG